MMKKMIKMRPQKANFKQLSFNEATGKLYLEDYNNNKFECNLFGSKIPTFYPNITGFATFSQRQAQTHLPSIPFKPCETQYLPQPRFFEGYAQFPLPLCQPFTNMINNPLSIHKMMTQENRLKHNNKNRRLITIKTNEGLNYLTSTLAGDEKAIKDHLINSINNYIAEFKMENKYKPELVFHDHNIKALKKLRRMLKINFDITTVNDKALNRPHEDIQQKYNLIRKHYMIPLNKKRNLTIEHNEMNKTMINVLSQQSTFQRTDSAFSFGKTTMNFSPKKLQKEQLDISFMSNENEKNTNTLTNLNSQFNSISNENILFNCAEETRLLTGFQPLTIKEEAIIKKGKPKVLTAGDLYQKDILLMQKVNPIVIKREKEKNEFDRKVLEKKKKNKMIYEKIKIVKK